MEFHHLILYAVVGWMLYTWELPDPLKNFLWSVGDEFLVMCLWSAAFIIDLCLRNANFLNQYAIDLPDKWQPGFAPNWVPQSQRGVHLVAYVSRLVGNRLLALCIKSLSHRYGDTLAAVTLWLARI